MRYIKEVSDELIKIGERISEMTPSEIRRRLQKASKRLLSLQKLKKSSMYLFFLRFKISFLLAYKKNFRKVLNICIGYCPDEPISRYLKLPEWEKGAGVLAASASKEIVACFRRRDGRLNLSNLQLKNLPDCLFFLHLTHFDCANNRLREFPDLPSLKTLDCSYNELSGFFFSGKHLKVLNCSFNRLRSLPKGLNKSPLKRLSCKRNRLQTLPPFSKACLQSLDCSHNELDFLPEALSRCPLSKLNCSFNRLTALPNLSNVPLKEFDCQNNRIQELFPLGKCPMKILNFSYNEIKKWPEECANCPLEEIIGIYNRVNFFPKVLSCRPLKTRHLWPQKPTEASRSPWIPLKIGTLNQKKTASPINRRWQVLFPEAQEKDGESFGTGTRG